ncbi:MAG: DUF4860 domain-containing protein [Lachnospiraceae bacterium]|nr:DUF4860 domain-containing protein [Lachnospiraceae bacterium]
MQGKSSQHIIDILFVLGVLVLSVVLGLFLIGAGTGVYKNLLAKADANERLRTPIAYVTQKVRGYGTAGAVKVDEIDGIPALALKTTIQDADYITYLYADGGNLKELFMPSDAAKMHASAGLAVTPADSMTFQEEGDALYVALTVDGKESRFLLHTLPGEEVAP